MTSLLTSSSSPLMRGVVNSTSSSPSLINGPGGLHPLVGGASQSGILPVDDLRSSSIATLRQKAQEHAARLGLNNNNVMTDAGLVQY